MILIRLAVLASLVMGLAACGPKEKTSLDISGSASILAKKYMAANRLPEAESALQDAIMKTQEPFLMTELLELYEKTKQWKKMEDYIEINERYLSWDQLQGTQTVIARQYFTNQDWKMSASFFMKAADVETRQKGVPEENRACPSVAPENLRNVAAARFNDKDIEGISIAHRKLKELSSDRKCQRPDSLDEIKKQTDLVRKMGDDLLMKMGMG